MNYIHNFTNAGLPQKNTEKIFKRNAKKLLTYSPGNAIIIFVDCDSSQQTKYQP